MPCWTQTTHVTQCVLVIYDAGAVLCISAKDISMKAQRHQALMKSLPMLCYRQLISHAQPEPRADPDADPELDHAGVLDSITLTHLTSYACIACTVLAHR